MAVNEQRPSRQPGMQSSSHDANTKRPRAGLPALDHGREFPTLLASGHVSMFGVRHGRTFGVGLGVKS